MRALPLAHYLQRESWDPVATQWHWNLPKLLSVIVILAFLLSRLLTTVGPTIPSSKIALARKEDELKANSPIVLPGPAVLWESTAPCTLPITRRLMASKDAWQLTRLSYCERALPLALYLYREGWGPAGTQDTEPTDVVVGHCYPGISAVLVVVGDGMTNDFVFIFVFENTDARWPERRKNYS